MKGLVLGESAAPSLHMAGDNKIGQLPWVAPTHVCVISNQPIKLHQARPHGGGEGEAARGIPPLPGVGGGGGGFIPMSNLPLLGDHPKKLPQSDYFVFTISTIFKILPKKSFLCYVQ